MNKRLIVIGGGAAGFFCAVNTAAANPQLEVIIIERSGKLLSKVRVSGGGRCNVTHASYKISEMIRNYPRGANFLKKAFLSFFTTDTIEWFSKHGVNLKTEADGRMFPTTNSSETIINCLVREASKYNVKIILNKQVKEIMIKDIEKNKDPNIGGQSIILRCADDKEMSTDFLCIACGGFPKAEQFDWIRKLGHQVEPPVPSLFTFNLVANKIIELMGVTVEKVNIKISGTKFSQQGPLLITHWGFSGPAVLKLSAFAATELAALSYHYRIVINWIPDFNENTLREEFSKLRVQMAGKKIINHNPFHLPQRLWAFLMLQSGINEADRWADLPSKQQNQFIKYLCTNEFEIKGKTTFKDEFVTSGGVSLNEIDPNTMESKLISHVFFAGEVMNVDGITGGFNFQHAWTSGWIAAKSIASRS